MKRILIAALLLITHNVNAQSGIQIINNSNCDVWFTLYGSTTVGCGAINYESTPILIPCCSTTFSYSSPVAVPGGMLNMGTPLSSSDYINMISIWNAEPNGPCDWSSVDMSDCNTTDTHYTTIFGGTGCEDICTLTVTWTPASGGATNSTVTIN